MFRVYIATALLSFALYTYAQYRGWSVMPSEAQEFQSHRSGDSSSSYGRGSSGSGGTTGSSSSGHK